MRALDPATLSGDAGWEGEESVAELRPKAVWNLAPVRAALRCVRPAAEHEQRDVCDTPRGVEETGRHRRGTRVKIEKASAAAALGRELMAGDLPVVEITLRTTAAEEVIRGLWHEMLDLLVGV